MERFQEHANEFPWTWRAQHVDEYFADRRSVVDRPLSLSTLRSYTGSIQGFCCYVTDARYGWAELCERIFGDVPSQVVFEWNSLRTALTMPFPPLVVDFPVAGPVGWKSPRFISRGGGRPRR